MTILRITKRPVGRKTYDAISASWTSSTSIRAG